MVNLILGDCLEKMKDLPDNCIDSIVTDCPYGISFMNKKWDYDIPSIEIWEECLRILKPGGHLLSFGGSRTFHRIAVNIEDAGFEVRDTIMWVYGKAFPKSTNIGRALDKRNIENDLHYLGTALKPAHEPIIMARKPFKGTLVDNVLTYGTGALNIDGCRVSSDEDFSNVKPMDVTKLNTKRNDETEEEARLRKKLGSQSVEEAMEKLKSLGRWPANFIHDGSDVILEGFPDTASSSSSNKNKDGGDFPDNTIKLGLKKIQRNGFDDSGSAARYFYCAKASKKDREENNTHPTVKPTELMRYLCRLITPKNGIVLDPFMGSGSTGKAALLEGFSFIGIEMDEDYYKIATGRVKDGK